MTAAAAETHTDIAINTAGNDQRSLTIPINNHTESSIHMISGDGKPFMAASRLIIQYLRDHFPQLTHLLLVTDCTVAELHLPTINKALCASDLNDRYQLLTFTIPPGTRKRARLTKTLLNTPDHR